MTTPTPPEPRPATPHPTSEPEVVRQPDGYAYRYPAIDGTITRFNHGQEANGSRPLYAIPYWLGQPPTPQMLPVPVAERLPEGVTDEELLRCYGLAKRDHCYEGPMDDWPKRAERAATVHGLRAILTRYARPSSEPVAYLRRQGNYTEASEFSLSEEEKARGWTEEPLYIHHALPAPGAEVG
jgi:hypothetical protein